MKKIKITQVKSAIDRPERQKLTLRALGLNKMNASREVVATDQILGMVRTVNHLLKIEEGSAQSINAQEPEAAILQTPEPIRFTQLPQAEIPQPATEEPVAEVPVAEVSVTQLPALDEPVEDVSGSLNTEVADTEEETKA